MAVGNPKVILIFTAFLPQFIDATAPAMAQFADLGAWFLLLEWVAIAAYAAIGADLRRLVCRTPAAPVGFNRVCAALLGTAGVGLLAARRSAGGV